MPVHFKTFLSASETYSYWNFSVSQSHCCNVCIRPLDVVVLFLTTFWHYDDVMSLARYATWWWFWRWSPFWRSIQSPKRPWRYQKFWSSWCVNLAKVALSLVKLQLQFNNSLSSFLRKRALASSSTMSERKPRMKTLREGRRSSSEIGRSS